MDAFLDNGKEYQASPSSSRGDQTNLIARSSNHTTSHNKFKAYNIMIESQSVN